jgi:hypothetical protein
VLQALNAGGQCGPQAGQHGLRMGQLVEQRDDGAELHAIVINQ